MVRALVTGAAGFIGSHLTERLLAQGADVVAVDSFTDNYPRWLKQLNLAGSSRQASCSFVEGDLLELDLAELLQGVDLVFHQAAWPGVRASWGSAFDGYTRNNVLATQRLLEAARQARLAKFVYASSSSVYGDSERYPTGETTLPRPISPYGVTKLAAEHLCFLYWRRSKLPVVSLRYFTVYGPRQRPDMAFHIFIRNLLTGDPIEVFGDGGQSREFTFVDDVVTANLLAAERGRPGAVYNIGGGSEVTLAGAIETVRSLTGRDGPVRYRAEQAGDARRTAADIGLARRELGYRPEVGLEEGLCRQIAWLEEAYALQPVQTAKRETAGPETLLTEAGRP